MTHTDLALRTMINTSIIDCKIKLYIDINYLQVKCLPTKFFVLKKNPVNFIQYPYLHLLCLGLDIL